MKSLSRVSCEPDHVIVGAIGKIESSATTFVDESRERAPQPDDGLSRICRREHDGVRHVLPRQKHATSRRAGVNGLLDGVRAPAKHFRPDVKTREAARMRPLTGRR